MSAFKGEWVVVKVGLTEVISDIGGLACTGAVNGCNHIHIFGVNFLDFVMAAAVPQKFLNSHDGFSPSLDALLMFFTIDHVLESPGTVVVLRNFFALFHQHDCKVNVLSHRDFLLWSYPGMGFFPVGNIFKVDVRVDHIGPCKSDSFLGLQERDDFGFDVAIGWCVGRAVTLQGHGGFDLRKQWRHDDSK